MEQRLSIAAQAAVRAHKKIMQDHESLVVELGQTPSPKLISGTLLEPY